MGVLDINISKKNYFNDSILVPQLYASIALDSANLGPSKVASNSHCRKEVFPLLQITL